jgi:hypothetical protein
MKKSPKNPPAVELEILQGKLIVSTLKSGPCVLAWGGTASCVLFDSKAALIEYLKSLVCYVKESA